ncbi:MAG: N-acyl homoserine lactonase family protein [Syntrophomonadaceae bacterium]|nr:N-acyl homoserine lactonase family protein [Syntrophomonadaceae bacterium]
MAQYRIYPIMVGKNTANKAIFTHMVDMDINLVVPVYVYYIEGGHKKILVDTGVMELGSTGLYNGISIKEAGPQAVCAGLKKFGVNPEDIDIVILTHLHFDHAANLELFPQAVFFVQESEVIYAQEPLPIQKDDYLPGIAQLLNKYQVVTVDGNSWVAPGVEIIHAPGHTSGFQIVAVDTSEGKYIIAGDLVYLYLNLYPDTSEIIDADGNRIQCTPIVGHDIYPPGNNSSLTDWYTSISKVLSLCGDKSHIIPGHCPTIMGKIFP